MGGLVIIWPLVFLTLCSLMAIASYF